jgi:hypothetical protein
MGGGEVRTEVAATERDLEWARDERLALPILAAAFKRWKEQPPIDFRASRVDAFTLMGCLQLAWRHPDLSEAQHAIIEGFGRQIQGALAESPELDDLMEAGWRRDFDVR